MSFDPTNAAWTKTGCTASASGIITEDSSLANRHSIYQDIQSRLVDAGLGTSAGIAFKVRPLGRDRCWIGCRQNNGNFMASFLLSGSGSVSSSGSNVTSASILDNGDGSYWCSVIWSGNFSTSATVAACGAMLADATQSYDGAGIDALQIEAAQLFQGTTSQPYASTTDLSSYPDLQTGDGAQDADLPGSSAPSILNPGYIVASGGNPLDAGDVAIDLDALTVVSVVSWDGTTGAEKVLAGQWGAGDLSWKMALTSAGKLQVSLSGNGTSAAKVYTAVRALDLDAKALCAFTWDGSTLRLFYNDVELTTGAGELTKDTDSALSGNLHDSSSSLEQFGGHYGRGYEFNLHTAVKTPAEIATIAAGFGVSGLPAGGGGGGDTFPTTLAGMVDWLLDKGATAIRYVDNLDGNDANTGTSTSQAWATIQKASNTLTPGQAVIIRGRGGRFFEQVTIGASGSAGALIWYAGDPENPPIMDASQSFSATWTDQGSGRWRAPYGQSRPYSASASYYSNCTTGNCRDELTWISHQLIHNDVQLVRISQASVPASLGAGECYFEVGTGSYNTPQYVWCRLPGDANPNGASMRIGSSKTKLFDYSPFTWTQDGVAFPGGTGGQETSGRSYIGLVNMHFKFGCVIRKVAPVSLRGTGWHVERCSFLDANTINLTIHGSGHYIYNCNFARGGQQSAFWAYADDVHMQRCRLVVANIHRYPGSWEAAHCKMVECAQALRCEISECMFDGCVGAPALWWDVNVGDGNPAEEAFFVHHCYFKDNAKGQLFFERRCEFLALEDSVVFNGYADDEGQSANVLGPGLRFQACWKTTIRRVVVANHEGKGMLYKADDGDHACNFDTFDRIAFIMNCKGSALGAIDQGVNEVQGGDDPNFPSSTWDTSTITNLLVTNTRSGVSNFRRRNPAPVTDTDSAATFEGWSGATGTTVVSDPATVVSDYTDERGCYAFLPAYSAWAPVGFVHPDDFPDVWVSPS